MSPYLLIHASRHPVTASLNVTQFQKKFHTQTMEGQWEFLGWIFPGTAVHIQESNLILHDTDLNLQEMRQH